MNGPSAHGEIERMLSAYLDNELTQAESQRVRVHLEDCPACRAAFEETQKLQRATASLAFQDPPEDRMEELEKALSVQAPRRLGWGLVIAGLLAWLAYIAFIVIKDFRPPTLVELIAGAVPVGFLLVFLSVVRERWLELPHDRYRRVKK